MHKKKKIQSICNGRIYVQNRSQEAQEWEEACLQFQGCLKLLPRVTLILKRMGAKVRKERELLYTSAPKALVVEAILRTGCPSESIIDVDVPICVGRYR